MSQKKAYWKLSSCNISPQERINLYPLLISVGTFLTFDNVVMMSFTHDTLITNLRGSCRNIRRQTQFTFSFPHRLRNSNKLRYISYEASSNNVTYRHFPNCLYHLGYSHYCSHHLQNYLYYSRHGHYFRHIFWPSDAIELDICVGHQNNPLPFPPKVYRIPTPLTL